MIANGTLVEVKSESVLGNPKGTAGICYDINQDLELSFVIFENGCYDGFDDEEIKKYLTIVKVTDYKYQFTNAVKLDQDFKDGTFNGIYVKVSHAKKQKNDTATELKYLEWFRQNADFGPAHEDVISIMNEDFTEETGKQVPINWRSE